MNGSIAPRETRNETRWLKVLDTLNEFQARLYVADRALDWGRGGISHLSALTGMSRTTITKAVRELQSGRKVREPKGGGVRQPGAGRPKADTLDPHLRQELTRIVEDNTAGDPMSLLRWTCKSSRTIAAELTRLGHPVQADTVRRLLHAMDYSLQLNVKSKEARHTADRDRQFRYLNRQVKAFRRSQDPVISVDTKKQELIGPFKNAGRTWRRRGRPKLVNVHDFRTLSKGKGIPYGAYDEAHNEALVNVGVTHDTAEFAVESLRRWWKLVGRQRYPHAQRLLLCADAGGSNGYRLRAWKFHLQQWADQLWVPITVCHYPPGTSKWNKIEHRLFSFISLNWKGQPLVNYETVINLIGGTRTQEGLKVRAALDTRYYKTGVKISKSEMNEIRLHRHKVFPQWNYTIWPRPAS
jgi:Rhodopirellula transposase DDE domain